MPTGSPVVPVVIPDPIGKVRPHDVVDAIANVLSHVKVNDPIKLGLTIGTCGVLVVVGVVTVVDPGIWVPIVAEPAGAAHFIGLLLADAVACGTFISEGAGVEFN